jgi:hypothetical protein
MVTENVWKIISNHWKPVEWIETPAIESVGFGFTIMVFEEYLPRVNPPTRGV